MPRKHTITFAVSANLTASVRIQSTHPLLLSRLPSFPPHNHQLKKYLTPKVIEKLLGSKFPIFAPPEL